MDPYHRDLLSKRMYRDFFDSEQNDIPAKLLEKTIFMQVSDDAQLSEHMLRKKQESISE